MFNGSSIVALAGNVFGLGEGGDFNHKSLIEWQKIIYIQKLIWKTEAPLLPNMRYALVAVHSVGISI